MARRPSTSELVQQGRETLSPPGVRGPSGAKRDRRLARLRTYVPSEQNRKIFQYVVIDHMTHYEVASVLGISRQRVAKIVERMRDWIALCGGDDAAYEPQQRYRLATHVAYGELAAFERHIQKALEVADRLVETKTYRPSGQGGQECVEHKYQGYPRPASLYKMLLTAILARARLAGAGRDAEGLLRVAQSPSKEALPSDVLSGSTYVERCSESDCPTNEPTAS